MSEKLDKNNINNEVIDNKIVDSEFIGESSIVKSILGLLSFSTIIPLNTHVSLKSMAKVLWLWPVLSGLIGLLGSIIVFILIDIVHLNTILTAAIVYSFFIWINGFHHLDGLIDFGDAIMAHGSPEKKISIMKDTNIGTGGISLLFVVGLITFAGFSSLLSINIDKIAILLILTELCGKISLLTTSLTSISGNDGLGKPFIDEINIKKYIISIIISLAIGAIISKFLGISIFIPIFAILGGIFAGGLIAYISKRNFKIANGDVLGTSNEIGRMCALIFILIVINLF
ncbi:MAG: adenosylcobinamide-GDP ribazoletransferase [Methanobrevibacter sp.]|jgi:adenosylcobinamide-GDP ribazoletransferase|nr:adenosylcobinamide-GDP ribazoletransferase [Methanobrevibacter sp.]